LVASDGSCWSLMGQDTTILSHGLWNHIVKETCNQPDLESLASLPTSGLNSQVQVAETAPNPTKLCNNPMLHSTFNPRPSIGFYAQVSAERRNSTNDRGPGSLLTWTPLPRACPGANMLHPPKH
jgi:hypothetical protein